MNALSVIAALLLGTLLGPAYADGYGVSGGPFSAPVQTPAPRAAAREEGSAPSEQRAEDTRGDSAEADRAAALLNYFRFVFGAPREARQREYETALAGADEAGLMGRLHYAMLVLATDRADSRARALHLLERALQEAVAGEEIEQSLLDLAHFTLYVLRALEAQDRVAAQEARRAVQLEEKVKALLSIEEGLRERLQQQGAADPGDPPPLSRAGDAEREDASPAR